MFFGNNSNPNNFGGGGSMGDQNKQKKPQSLFSLSSNQPKGMLAPGNLNQPNPPKSLFPEQNSLFKQQMPPSHQAPPSSFFAQPAQNQFLPLPGQQQQQQQQNRSEITSALLNRCLKQQFPTEKNFRFVSQTLVQMPSPEPNFLLCLVMDDATQRGPKRLSLCSINVQDVEQQFQARGSEKFIAQSTINRWQIKVNANMQGRPGQWGMSQSEQIAFSDLKGSPQDLIVSKTKFLSYSKTNILFGPLPEMLQINSGIMPAQGSSFLRGGSAKTIENGTFLDFQDGRGSTEILEVQFSQTNANYIYILAIYQRQQYFLVLNMDEEHLVPDGAPMSLIGISEQVYTLPNGVFARKFIQNQSDNLGHNQSIGNPLFPFEVLFFTESTHSQGAVYSLCPVIPKQKTILSQTEFSSIFLLLKKIQKSYEQIGEESEKVNAQEAIHIANLIDNLQFSKKDLPSRDDLCTINLKKYTSLKATARRFEGPYPIQGLGTHPLLDFGTETIEVKQIRLPINLTAAQDIDIMAFIRIQMLPNKDIKVQQLVSIDRDDEPSLNPSFSLTLINEMTAKRHHEDLQSGKSICLFDSPGAAMQDKLLILQSGGQSYLTLDYMSSLVQFIQALEDECSHQTSFPIKIDEIKLGSQNLPSQENMDGVSLFNSFNLFSIPCREEQTNDIVYQFLLDMSSPTTEIKNIDGLIPKQCHQDQKTLHQQLEETDLISNFKKRLPANADAPIEIDLTAQHRGPQAICDQFHEFAAKVLMSQQTMGCSHHFEEVYQAKMESLENQAQVFEESRKWYLSRFKPMIKDLQKEQAQKQQVVAQNDLVIKNKINSVQEKLERFRAIQKSLTGQDELNEIRVRFNRLASKLQHDKIEHVIPEMERKADFIKKEDEDTRKVVRYCQDAAIKESQSLHRVSFGEPERGYDDQPGKDLPMVWIHDFVRKTRMEVEDVRYRIAEVKAQIDGQPKSS